MLFSDHPRTHYPHAPVHEVICQLRFPTIPAILNAEPADFQAAIQADFPRCSRRQEEGAPRLVANKDGKPELRKTPPFFHYSFLSEDGRWKISLTPDYIALSTLRYPGWEEFARHLDKPLASFIQLYHPACFQRLGLRYVNLVSRKTLGLEDYGWDELFAPAYTAVFQEDDATEQNVLTTGTDLMLQLDSSCRVKIHAGPGRIQTVQPDAPIDNEIKFIFDMDLAMLGNTPCQFAAPGLETIHAHGTRLFEGAITDDLRDAISRE